jgi:hypothetical protein
MSLLCLFLHTVTLSVYGQSRVRYATRISEIDGITVKGFEEKKTKTTKEHLQRNFSVKSKIDKINKVEMYFR